MGESIYEATTVCLFTLWNIYRTLLISAGACQYIAFDVWLDDHRDIFSELVLKLLVWALQEPELCGTLTPWKVLLLKSILSIQLCSKLRAVEITKAIPSQFSLLPSIPPLLFFFFSLLVVCAVAFCVKKKLFYIVEEKLKI